MLPRLRSSVRAISAPLQAVPPDSLRVEYGRTGAGLYVRVRVDESALPSGLSDE